MRIVLIPGWNEGAADMRVFANGRRGIPGLTARGFKCAAFDGGRGSLGDRIDQLAQFLAGLGAAPGSEDEPIVLFGYSAGGVIARGLVKARRCEAPIAGIFQLAAPNAGIVTDDVAGLLHRLHFSKSVIEDLDLESDFMQRLNGTLGHWETDGNAKRWRLDRTPWVCGDVPVYNVAGRVPHYRLASDGVVLVDSATLDGHLAHAFIDDRRANHLNLSGTWNPLTVVLRRWLRDDRLWPRVVDAAIAFVHDLRPERR